MVPQARQRGFTLIEVIIAMFIVVAALLGLLGVTVTAINGNQLGKMVTTATTLAKDKVEDLKGTAYGSIVSGGPETFESAFTRQWTVTNNSPAANMKTIVVTVNWVWKEQTRNVTINTIVAR